MSDISDDLDEMRAAKARATQKWEDFKYVVEAMRMSAASIAREVNTGNSLAWLQLVLLGLILWRVW